MFLLEDFGNKRTLQYKEGSGIVIDISGETILAVKGLARPSDRYCELIDLLEKEIPSPVEEGTHLAWVYYAIGVLTAMGFEYELWNGSYIKI